MTTKYKPTSTRGLTRPYVTQSEKMLLVDELNEAYVDYSKKEFKLGHLLQSYSGPVKRITDVESNLHLFGIKR